MGKSDTVEVAVDTIYDVICAALEDYEFDENTERVVLELLVDKLENV